MSILDGTCGAMAEKIDGLDFAGGAIHLDYRPAQAASAVPLPLILFVHGVGADTAIWDDWRGALGDGFATAALDLPGHGRSFRATGPIAWTFEDVAGLVARAAAFAARRAGTDRVILIGESVGGTACLAAAAGNPLVAAVAVCSTAHVGGALENVRPWRERIAADGLGAWSDDMLEKRFAPGQTDAAHRAWFGAAQRASDAESILALADLLVGLDLTPKLPSIACPVLLMQPDASPFIPLAVPVALKQGLSDADLMVLPGTRHGIACSHGAVCAEATLAFLRRRGVVSER